MTDSHVKLFVLIEATATGLGSLKDQRHGVKNKFAQVDYRGFQKAIKDKSCS